MKVLCVVMGLMVFASLSNATKPEEESPNSNRPQAGLEAAMAATALAFNSKKNTILNRELKPSEQAVVDLFVTTTVAALRYEHWSLPRYSEGVQKGMIDYPSYIARNSVSVLVPLAVAYYTLGQMRKKRGMFRFFFRLPIFAGMTLFSGFNVKRAAFDWVKDGTLRQVKDFKEVQQFETEFMRAYGEAVKKEGKR